MTARDFVALHQQLGISRAALCRAIGISPNAGTAYARGHWPDGKPAPIPRTVALACSAVFHNLAPFTTE